MNAQLYPVPANGQVPPGYAVLRDGMGRLWMAPTSGVDFGRQAEHGLGQHPQEFADALKNADDEWSAFEKVPAFYTVAIDLAGDDGATAANSTTVRPEPFVCRRITWATTGDCPVFVTGTAAGGSPQGRSVLVSFEDEFTKFLGKDPVLVSALFGDSQGYLDLPRRGILFQGKQSLSVSLRRLFWPDPDSQADLTSWYFSFQGFGLLPKGVHQSGSAG